jgi:hypothetical protein
MTTTRHRQPTSEQQRPAWLWVLYICDAGLMIASGVIHFHLWVITGGYRDVATLNVLFPIQVILAVLLAATLLVTRHLLVVVASLLLMAGTIVGFVLADTVGIFGFKLPEVTGLADTVLVLEIVAVVLLAATGLAMRRASR